VCLQSNVLSDTRQCPAYTLRTKQGQQRGGGRRRRASSVECCQHCDWHKESEHGIADKHIKLSIFEQTLLFMDGVSESNAKALHCRNANTKVDDNKKQSLILQQEPRHDSSTATTAHGDSHSVPITKTIFHRSAAATVTAHPRAPFNHHTVDEAKRSPWIHWLRGL